MITIRFGGYSKKDKQLLLKHFSSPETSPYCIGYHSDYTMCREDPRKCKYHRVCEDITSVLNYLYIKCK